MADEGRRLHVWTFRTAGTNYLYANDKALLWIVKRAATKGCDSLRRAQAFSLNRRFVFYLVCGESRKRGPGMTMARRVVQPVWPAG